MILKGNQRSGARQLALHLMNVQDNDHIAVHELRGFISHNLLEALTEAYALSRGTKCKQYLFSLSLSPPEREAVPITAFERAIEAIEMKIGLAGQPRTVIFHEKEGRRHAHCVWSRIDVSTMTAINLSHYKIKLREMSRSLFLEHGWKLPRGLANSAERDPFNFTLEEWQKAKRLKQDPRVIKAAFQDAWAISDSVPAFAQALAARGYYLARGDRRSFVAVDLQGEVYAIARWAGIRNKEVNARLGDPAPYLSVEEMSAKLAERMSEKLKLLLRKAHDRHAVAVQALQERRRSIVLAQRQERQRLEQDHVRRRAVEMAERITRFPTGLKGLWSRLTGGHAKIKTVNEAETRACDERDREEMQSCIERHLGNRGGLQEHIRLARSQEVALLRRIHRDISVYMLGPRLAERQPSEHCDRRRDRRRDV